MHPSEQIEIYCIAIREKFLKTRKMTYPARVRHVQMMVQYLNCNYRRQIDPKFILKIMCLDSQEESESWYNAPD